MSHLHAPPSPSMLRPTSAEGAVRRSGGGAGALRHLGLGIRRSAEGGLGGSSPHANNGGHHHHNHHFHHHKDKERDRDDPPRPALFGQLHIELVSARGLRPGGSSTSLGTEREREREREKAQSSTSLLAQHAAPALHAASPPPSPGGGGPNLVVLVRGLPDSRPKKLRSEPRRYEAAAGMVAWNQRLALELRRGTALALSVHTLAGGMGRARGASGATVARAELPLLPLQLVRAAPVTLDVPLLPQGELRLVLTFADATPLFGLELAAVCFREQEDVPSIVRKCCEAVEANGLHNEGIYRVPGNKPAIDALVQAFTEDAKNFQFTAKDVLHINSVASLLKQYLQALPEPVMTAKARPMFAAALGMEDGPAKEARFGELLQSLPAANRSTSLYLLAHMIKIVGATESNKMDAANLAICFGPTMLGMETAEDVNLTGSSGSQELLQSLRKPRVENEVIKYILQHPDIVTHAMRNVKTASQYSDSTSPGEHGDSAAVAPSPPEEPPENPSQPQSVISLFQKFDTSHTGQLSHKGLRLLCFELGRLLSLQEEMTLFERLSGGQGGISWPSFRAWWEMNDRAPLSPEARSSLAAAVAFFRLYAGGDGRTASAEAMRRIRDEILLVNLQLELSDLDLPPAVQNGQGSISVKEYLRWLVQHDLL